MTEPIDIIAPEILEPANIPRRFWNLDQQNYFGEKRALKEVRRYLRKHKHVFVQGLNLMLTGNRNSGKTFLGCLLLKNLIHYGYTVRYITLSELVTLMLQPLPGQSFFRDVKMPQFLMVDSLDDDSLNEGSRLALRRMISLRRDEALPTILASINADDGSEDSFFTNSLGESFARFKDLAFEVHCEANPFKVAQYLEKIKRL